MQRLEAAKLGILDIQSCLLQRAHAKQAMTAAMRCRDLNNLDNRLVDKEQKSALLNVGTRCVVVLLQDVFVCNYWIPTPHAGFR